MALLNKIRERSGLAVGIIAFGLILFLVGSEVFSPNSMLFNRNNVGEIDGVTISTQMYTQAIQEQEQNFINRTGSRPSSDQSRQVRDFAWQSLVSEIAYQHQYEDLGIVVTDDERYDIVQGGNIMPEVMSYFRDPETGEFNPELQRQFFANYNQYSPEQRAQWQGIENLLVDARQRIKYESLLTKSAYVTTAEAKKAYENQNTVAEARYLYVPYYTIPDSAVSLSDSDLRNYFNAHQEDFRLDEETRGISFVSFPIVASASDSTYSFETLQRLVGDFKTTSEDSAFARRNSSSRQGFYQRYNMANITPQVTDMMVTAQVGDVIGPVLEGSSYALYKISDMGSDSVAVARASHILIRAEGEDDDAKAEARKQAQDLINRIRGGESFAALAEEFGTDGTAQNGGDLGWFDENRMVEEFADAVFSRNSTGLINTPVETQFGYHVIEVTEAPQRTYYTIAKIDAPIEPSEATIDNVYRNAGQLLAQGQDNLLALEKAASAAGLPILAANNILPSADRFNSIREARDVVRWAFNDASEGDVANQIFSVKDAFLVVGLANVREAGVPSLASVMPQVRAGALKEKKADAIIAKMGDVSSQSIDELAGLFNGDATINSSSDLRASSNSMANIGFAPKALGAAMGLQEGEMSSPIQENNGVVVVSLESRIAANQQNSYEGSRQSLMNQTVAANRGSINGAIEEKANIEDKRFRIE